MSRPVPGKLYVVATPIGNPGDLGPRALEVLSQATMVAAEDTRRAGRLLSGLPVRPRLLSLHAHNYRERLPELLSAIRDGAVVALITDAGTPAVSDPGGAVVAAAWEQGLRVVPVPGPSAVSAALSVAGFPAERYLFAGYVPRKPGRRLRYWQWIDRVGETTVLFETPHRLSRTLSELAERWPRRQALLARELTKTHEELLRGPLEELHQATRERTWRGELTLVLAPGGGERAGQVDGDGEDRAEPDEN